MIAKLLQSKKNALQGGSAFLRLGLRIISGELRESETSLIFSNSAQFLCAK